jgi:ribosomal protein L24
MVRLKVGDHVDIVGGSYKGDQGKILKFNPVRVETRLFNANKVANLSRESLSRRQPASRHESQENRRQQQRNSAEVEEEDQQTSHSDSVDYIMRAVARLRLTQREKKELVDRIEGEIQGNIINRSDS